MILKFRLFLLFVILLFSVQESVAQVCTGALGDPIVGAGTDFGRGASNFGTSLGAATNYTFVSGTPNDGQYTIAKSTNNLNSGWHWTIPNHTPNDPDGYMMVVNANLGPGIFYQTTVNNLCPDVTYEFAAFIINILKNPGIKPNVKFTIENNGNELASFSTGDILEGTGSYNDWKKYGTTFTTPVNIGIITLKMTNENPGGTGNDLALDDITFRACGPVITPRIDNVSSTIKNFCVGDPNATVHLSANVSSGYSGPRYQWQSLAGTTWTNLPGATTTQFDVAINTSVAVVNQYRLAVANGNNINSTNCRIYSVPISINVNAKPQPLASVNGNGVVCVGQNIQLSVNDGVIFSWTGPNNYISTDQNPMLLNVSTDNSGLYKVEVTNAAGCKNTSEVNVQVIPRVVPTINITTAEICENNSVQLIAGGGIIYKWTPTIGLSNPNIANPIASPKEPTIYKVEISNGSCSEFKTVDIFSVLKLPKADAGKDIKMVAGQNVPLRATASGDHISYSWSPIDDLDDPTKLNPIASPKKDITYTLTVTSECGISTDDVFVKVYPKIEIPNTFTPNGDNLNDTWEIPSISSFTNSRLIVYNRSGQMIYTGYNNSAWDGRYNGKDVASGVYYYTLYLSDGYKTYSGWVLITR